MKSKPRQAIRIATALFVALAATSLAEPKTAVSFIAATPENTFLSDGSRLPVDLASCGWEWAAGKGKGGVFESSRKDGSAAILMVSAKDLTPGATYEVFGYFWADDLEAESKGSQELGAVRFGLTLAALHPFDGERPDEAVAKEPWIISPGYKTGEAYGYEAKIEEDAPLEGLTGLQGTKGASRLIRARLGFSRAGKDGTLPVFFSDFVSDRSEGRCTVDGIALRPADPNAVIGLGWKSGTQLHLAIRAGDPVTIRREIEAGADVNAFDEERLTALFHAAACGDVALVRDLLKHGAKPEQPGQSVSPLVAAASISHVEITRLLLEVGAEVPLVSPKDKGALAIDIDPRFLHPVVAAIRSGSVPVLKLLLAEQPALRIESLFTDLERIEIERRNLIRIPDPYLVAHAIVRQNWEMAAFLIDRGLHIAGWGISHYKNPDSTMMARAVAAGDAALPVVEAMLRRRISPVFEGGGVSFAGDGLGAAVWSRNAGLVKRFMPFARGVSPAYQQRLLQNAIYTENQEIIGIISRQFPDARVTRWQPGEDENAEEALDESAARLFLPRTAPPAKAAPPGQEGSHVLAVIASPEAAAPGEILSVIASNAAGWKVVDRELIEATLREDGFSKPWLDGEHRLADLGDRLTADCLVVVSAIRAGKETIHRFEVVEVATGMEVHREHFKGAAEKELTSFLGRAAQALDAASRNERHQAITLLSFSTQGKIKNSLAMTSLLRAAVQREVDATPGFISLNRAQSSRLVEEQALQGKNSVWGAAHLIEGVISETDDGRIRIALRLETLKNGTSVTNDAEATAGSLPEAVAEAWGKLLAKAGTPSKVPAQKADHPGHALEEGRRLLREAEWLHSLDANPVGYLPLIESAIALGVPSEETIPLHLDGYFRQFTPLGWRRSWLTDGAPTTKLQDLPEIFNHLPHSPAVSDELAHKLPLARRFLHQTAWYLDRGGMDCFRGAIDREHLFETYKSNEIWYAIQALSYIRAIIYRKEIPAAYGAEFGLFADELDALTKRYFTLLRDSFDPDPERYFMQLTDAHLFQRNPELVTGMVEMVTTGAPLPGLLGGSSHMNHSIGMGIEYGIHGWMEPLKLLAHRMIERIGDPQSPHMRFRKADLECFVADCADRPQAVRRLLDATAEVFSLTDPYDGELDYELLSQGILNTHTTSYLFDRYPSGCSFGHGASMLPSLLLSPQPSPDLLIRQTSYLKALNALRLGNYQVNWKGHPAIESFKEKVASDHPEKLASIRDRGFRKRDSRRSTRISADPKAGALHSLIYGSGKSMGEADEPARKTEAPTLTATLLADLRKGGSPGIAIWPLVDETDPSRLWIHYFPTVGDKIRVNLPGNGAQSDDLDYKAPWLIAIDCRDGSIAQALDLHAAVGAAYGYDPTGRTCTIWDMAFDQNRSRILANVGWTQKGRASNGMHAVVIDKATGKSHPLPEYSVISEGKVHFMKELWEFRVGAVGIGERFYFLNSGSKRNGGATEDTGSSALSVFQIDPDLTVKPLTVAGRRPVLTPFDAIDRAPMAILRDGDRLFVANQSTLAHHTPGSGEWAVLEPASPQQPVGKRIAPVLNAIRDESLRAIHQIHMDGKPTGWTAIGWSHAPGEIPFVSKTHGERKILFKAAIPESFLNTTVASERMPNDKDGKPVFRDIPLKDHSRFRIPDLVVLAQTETDLILGMQTSDYYEWKRPSRNAPHLPFLWKVSKKEILALLAE